MPEANKNNKPKPKAKLYFGNADELAKTNNYVTPEYLQEVDKRRKDWNEFIGFLKKENVAGSENLDKGGAGLGYLKKWNKANPDKAFTQEDIKDVQYYSRNTKKETGERVNDGILGKVTSTFSFPDSRVNTYEMKNGQKVLVKSEDPNIGNYQYQADKINFGIAGKNKADVSKLPIYNKNSATTDISWDKNDPTANNLLKEQAKKRSLSGQSLSKPEQFVKPLTATEYHPAVQEQLEGSYFDNNQKVVDYNQNLQQQKQAEVQQQADTRTALQKKLATSKSKDFTKEEALDYFNETGKVLPQNKVQTKYAKNEKNQILDANNNPYKVTSEYKTPFKIEIKNFGKNTKDAVSDALLDIKNIGKPGVNLYGKPTKGYSLFQFAKIPLNLLEATAAPIKGLIKSTEIKLPTKRNVTKVNEEFGMPTFQNDNSDLTQKREGGVISNNMKKRTLKKYQYSYGGLTVTDLNKYELGGSNLATTGATVSPAAVGAGIGFGAEMVGALLPDKNYTDSEGNDLGSRKSVGESALEYGAKGAGITAALGGADFGIATALGTGYGAIKGLMEKEKMDKLQNEAATRITNKNINKKANTSYNWGTPNINTSQNFMFARGGMVLDYNDPNANAELELQETFQMPDGTVGNVDGPSHENGGIAVDLPEGTRIWSDKLKHNGKTFAKHTKPITNTIAKLEKQIEKNPVNSDAKENSIALLKNQLDYYFDTQETNKQNTEMKRTLREGGMIKRADGSYSKRGLWDNIRANKGSGKKPTPEMLKQERKINNEMEMGGYLPSDSTTYYKSEAKFQADLANTHAKYGNKKMAEETMKKSRKAYSDASRQQFKGKPGFDSMGNTIKKAMGGYMYGQGGTNNPGFNALPEEVQENILAHMSMGGEMYSLGGRLMDDHMYAEGGKLPQGVLQSRLEAHMSPEEADEYLSEYGKGGYTVRRSSDRKGKTHVVIGPDGTKKYFGDPNMGERGNSKHGKDAFYARHKKNLAGNPYFRAYARATWEEGGMMGDEYAEGGIHIKPENRGKFTAYAKSHGKGVQEMAAHIMANKEDYSPTIVKRANFAKNAAGWKHEMGGYLPMHQDGDMIGNPDRVAVGAINPKTGQPYTMEDVQVYTKSLGKLPKTFGTQYGGGQKHSFGKDSVYSTTYGDYEQNPVIPTSNPKMNYAQSTLNPNNIPLKDRIKFTTPAMDSNFDMNQVPEELMYNTPQEAPYVTKPFNQLPIGINRPSKFELPKFNANPAQYVSPENLAMGDIGESTYKEPGFFNKAGQFLQNNSSAIGQLAPGLISAGIQSNRINKLAAPGTLSPVNLEENVANPYLIDFSAERNAIDRAALTGMGEAQRGFGSSAAAQAFKNKARLNQLEATGRSFQGQENANAQLRNQFLAARQEAAMREAAANNDISKYNLENIYGFDKMKTESLNDITQYLGDVGSDYFGKEAGVDNRMRQLEMLAKSNYKGANRKMLDALYNSGNMTADEYEKHTGVKPEPKRNGGMIQYAEGGQVSPYKRTLNKVVNFDTNKAAQMMDAEYAAAMAANQDKYTSSITGLDYKVLPKAEKRALVTDMWREAHGEAPTQKQIESGVKAIEGKKVSSPKAKTMAEIVSSRWKTGTATPEQMAAQMTPEEQEKYFLGIKDFGQFGREQLAQGVDAVGSLGMSAIGNPLKSMFGTDLGFGSTDMSPEAVEAKVGNPNEYADAASNALLGIMGGKALGMAANKIIPKFYKPAAKYYNAEARNLELENAKKVYKANQANKNQRAKAKYYQEVPEPDIPRYVRNIANQEDEAFALEFGRRQNAKLNKKIESKLNIAEGADRPRKPRTLNRK